MKRKLPYSPLNNLPSINPDSYISGLKLWAQSSPLQTKLGNTRDKVTYHVLQKAELETKTEDKSVGQDEEDGNYNTPTNSTIEIDINTRKKKSSKLGID